MAFSISRSLAEAMMSDADTPSLLVSILGEREIQIAKFVAALMSDPEMGGVLNCEVLGVAELQISGPPKPSSFIDRWNAAARTSGISINWVSIISENNDHRREGT